MSADFQCFAVCSALAPAPGVVSAASTSGSASSSTTTHNAEMFDIADEADSYEADIFEVDIYEADIYDTEDVYEVDWEFF